jgi:hypothetical protein
MRGSVHMSEKVQVTIEQGNRREEATVQASFNVGEIYPHERDGKRVVTMRMYCDGTMEALKASIQNTAREDMPEEFDTALEEYCRMWLMKVLGLEHYPLQYKEDGTISGFSGEYEIVEEDKPSA